MKSFNHCIHGSCLNEFCGECELLLFDLEDWLDLPENCIESIAPYVQFGEILQTIN